MSITNCQDEELIIDVLKVKIFKQKKNWNVQSSTDHFFDHNLAAKAKKVSNIFEQYSKTDEMDADGFLNLLEELSLDFESKEAKVLIFYCKGYGLYFKKSDFESGMN